MPPPLFDAGDVHVAVDALVAKTTLKSGRLTGLLL